MKLKALPSTEQIREVLRYEPDTGRFFWRLDRPGTKCRAGAPAGYLAKSGYLLIRVDMKRFFAHRLAWKYVTGRDPTEVIDHVDGNTQNNRFENLRQASVSQNTMNSRARGGRKLPRGVYLQGKTQRFWACITRNGKSETIGTFATAEEASLAYQARAADLHGEYASVRK